MKKELAQELKDAGFPLHATGRITIDAMDGISHQEWKLPTLEELIEASTGQLSGGVASEFSLVGVFYEGKVRWMSRIKDADKQEVHESYGLTSVEAAARLWLAINKK